MPVSTFFVLNAILRYYFGFSTFLIMTCTQMNYNYTAFFPLLNLGEILNSQMPRIHFRYRSFIEHVLVRGGFTRREIVRESLAYLRKRHWVFKIQIYNNESLIYPGCQLLAVFFLNTALKNHLINVGFDLGSVRQNMSLFPS